jgi:hypothetical protein
MLVKAERFLRGGWRILVQSVRLGVAFGIGFRFSALLRFASSVGAFCVGEETASFAKQISLSALFATLVSRFCDLAASIASRALAVSKRSRLSFSRPAVC